MIKSSGWSFKEGAFTIDIGGTEPLFLRDANLQKIVNFLKRVLREQAPFTEPSGTINSGTAYFFVTKGYDVPAGSIELAFSCLAKERVVLTVTQADLQILVEEVEAWLGN